MVMDFSLVIRSQSPGKIVFWGLVREAAIVLLLVAVLDAAHAPFSAVIRH